MEEVRDTGFRPGPFLKPPLELGDDQGWDQPADAPAVDAEHPEAVRDW